MFKSQRFIIGIGVILLLMSLAMGRTTAGFADPAVHTARWEAVDTSALVSSDRQEDNAEKGTDEQEAIRQAVQTLVARWSDAVLPSSGWLHVVTHHTRDKDKTSLLPNGQPIPLNYISETWYRLDDRGQVVEAVALMRSEEGQPIQVGTFRENTWRNLTVGEKWKGEPFTPRLDLGFSADVARAPEWGSTLDRRMVTWAGRPAMRFVMRDEFAPPRRIEGYAQPVVRGERRAWFDPDSGALLLLERVLVMADGTERVVERVEPVTIERGVEPPAEVLALLQQEVAK